MSLNKKVLAVAIFGALASGNAFAANLSAAGGAVPAWFAKEIIATPTAPRTLTTSASGDTQLNWNIGYNFSVDEVRYARVECSDNLRFGAGTVVTSSDAAAASIGAINGLSTNVITFSLTSPAPANLIAAADILTVSGDHAITGTDTNVTCAVGLYDQPSQAQAGGSAGLIAGSSFSGAYLSFAPSYELVATSTTHTADVESVPSFSSFLADANTTAATASMGQGASAPGIAYRLRAPSATQAATFGINGAAVTLATMLAGTTTIVVAGDYALASTAGATPYDAAARGRVLLNGVAADALTATSATFNVGNAGFTGADFDLTRRAGVLIPVADYTATLRVAPAAAANYAVTDITGVKLGSIVRNGTELQAPLAQIPDGWYSRVILTNTSSVARPYAISVMTEENVNVTTGTLTGTIPANGTKVIDDVKNIFTGHNRATLNVSVAGPSNAIQGMYQIVNPTSGSISNETMVRPGTN